MPEVRFQVLVNGRPVCTAGLDGFGSLEARVSSTRLPAETLPAIFPPEEHLDLFVGGHDLAIGDVNWGRVPLSPGDEVIIRVFGPGRADPPTEVDPPGPDDLPF
jgi:hypothetical protein